MDEPGSTSVSGSRVRRRMTRGRPRTPRARPGCSTRSPTESRAAESERAADGERDVHECFCRLANRQEQLFRRQVKLTDTSTAPSTAPITLVNWDFNNNGSVFHASIRAFAGGGIRRTSTFPVVTPGGNSGDRRAAARRASRHRLRPAAANYKFALNATNTNGTTLFHVAERSRSKSRRSTSRASAAARLNIVTGGTANARATQGNIGDSATTFAWTFTPSGSRRASQTPDRTSRHERTSP